MRRLALACLLAVGCGGGVPVETSDVRVGAPAQTPEAQTLPRVPLTLPSGKTLSAEIARTHGERSIGMMFRTSLPEDAAMLFVFEREQPLTFWMKNTFVDLDMVFIRADKTIAAIHAAVPRAAPSTPDAVLARRSGPGKYVLELPAGMAARYGLKVGDALRFDEF